MIIWFIISGVIIIGSAVLAISSIRKYSHSYTNTVNFGVFLIQNPKIINQEFFNKLLSKFSAQRLTFSLETLIKGSDKAFVTYMPKYLAYHFPEARFLEIEDYSQQIEIENIDIYSISVIESANITHTQPLFSGLNLGPEQQVFYQVVTQSIFTNDANHKQFRGNIRLVIIAKDPTRRNEIYQTLMSHLTNSHLLINEKLDSKVYSEEYIKREINSKQEPKFSLNVTELTNLVKINYSQNLQHHP